MKFVHSLSLSKDIFQNIDIIGKVALGIFLLFLTSEVFSLRFLVNLQLALISVFWRRWHFMSRFYGHFYLLHLYVVFWYIASY